MKLKAATIYNTSVCTEMGSGKKNPQSSRGVL